MKNRLVCGKLMDRHIFNPIRPRQKICSSTTKKRACVRSLAFVFWRLKGAKYEIQKPSTCRATMFRCKFSLKTIVAKSRAWVYFEQQILALLFVFHQTHNLSRNKFARALANQPIGALHFVNPQQMFLLRVKLITQGENRETSTKPTGSPSSFGNFQQRYYSLCGNTTIVQNGSKFVLVCNHTRDNQIGSPLPVITLLITE